MIVIENERIIRFCVPVTHDANSAANRVLDKKELFTVGKQVHFLLGKFEARIECKGRYSVIMSGVEAVVDDARFDENFQKHRSEEERRGSDSGHDIAACFQCSILATLSELARTLQE